MASTSLPQHVTLFTGASMPSLGLGTWKSAPGAVKAAVIAAIEAGYRHIDCAAAYGNEGEVGDALSDVISRGIVTRAQLWITSKLWVASSFPEEVAPALTATLAALKLDYLDLYLVHWPFFITKGSPFPPPPENRLGYTLAGYLAVWRAMEAEVDAGRVRHIGTSNMSARKLADLCAAARVQPAVNQVEAHPFLAQLPLIKFCDAHKIAVTAYSPLGSPDRPARLVEEGDPAPLFNPVVVDIATRLGVSPAQVLIRWALQRGTIVIPKSTTPSRIIENADVWKFALTEGDMAALAALDGGGRLIKGLPFMTPEQKHWSELWDLDFDHSTVVTKA